jgi:hypothetical protein
VPNELYHRIKTHRAGIVAAVTHGLPNGLTESVKPDGGRRRGARFVARSDTAWPATRLHDLVGSRRRRGQWISVAAQYLGPLSGATRYRLLRRL